jgi:hypothetical protein
MVFVPEAVECAKVDLEGGAVETVFNAKRENVLLVV